MLPVLVYLKYNYDIRNVAGQRSKFYIKKNVPLKSTNANLIEVRNVFTNKSGDSLIINTLKNIIGKVNEFTYLGSSIVRAERSTKDIKAK